MADYHSVYKVRGGAKVAGRTPPAVKRSVEDVQRRQLAAVSHRIAQPQGPEGESTKWDDIQRKLGNLPEKVSGHSVTSAHPGRPPAACARAAVCRAHCSPTCRC